MGMIFCFVVSEVTITEVVIFIFNSVDSNWNFRSRNVQNHTKSLPTGPATNLTTTKQATLVVAESVSTTNQATMRWI